MEKYVELLKRNGNLEDEQFLELLSTGRYDQELFESAVDIRERYYGRDIYIRGLIEISNYCHNDCYYCGIRKSNCKATRYRLSAGEIMECCDQGYELGFRTFVMQGGEDHWFTDQRVCNIVHDIKTKYPDCAITLSIGEKSRSSYQEFYNAGADRYLLRHETANESHYRRLHPDSLSLGHRQRCLWDLKEIGFAVGSGFMVGSPGQKLEYLIEDIRFLQELEPDMIGIGPYLRHKDTPFADCQNGDFELTLRMLGVLRHLFPKVLLPSTTALGTINEQGRELGILAGANVVMPNLSPTSVRSKYELYDNKIYGGSEAAEYKSQLEDRMKRIGFKIVDSRGDRAE